MLGIFTITVVSEVSEEETGKVESELQDVTDVIGGRCYISPDVLLKDRPPIGGKEDLKKMFPECFVTEGKHFLDFECSIKLDPTVLPKAHPPRRVPLELKDKLSALTSHKNKNG